MTADAIVLGRVGVDLYPQQLETALEDVRTFEKFVGGFAGNVATGLARLGVRVAIVSAVGDDGHGRFVRRWLAEQGVDVSALVTDRRLPTALAFCEAWPPDRFPVTFYRFPTCPDWELRPEHLPAGLDAAPLLYASGTGLAREPSRGTTLAALAGRRRGTTTVFDLDWREALWPSRAAYGAAVRVALPRADVVLAGESELGAAELDPRAVRELGPATVVVKRGAEGASVIDASGETRVPRLPVPVVNGLGAGDAFAAAFGAALLAGGDAREAARRGNAAGAIVAARLACSAAMPRAGEVDALLAGARVVAGEVVTA